MPYQENVIRQTTKRVVTKTTKNLPSEEVNRAAAWQHLYTPPETDPDEWTGELARVNSEFSVATRELISVAAKYDHVVERARYRDPNLDETSVLAALLVIRALRDKLEADERRLIGAARDLKVTWNRIGHALEVKSRQAAERRYLQLRSELDDIAGDDLTQAERVEVARARRDRRIEYTWAAGHAAPIIGLALRLSAVSGLQQRADDSPAARTAYQRAANGAVFEGRPVPPPMPLPWPRRLQEAVQTYQAHHKADREYRTRPASGGPDEDIRPPAGMLAPAVFDRLVHDLFGLIGHALDIELQDHADLVQDVRELYREAGPASPRPPE
ncbi:hypothetical protein ACFCWT_26730 [Streptomyces olivaceus]|uniref:hypothetical protein n=1 Tax=Streptomyces olivaceus TaxID=47716 RepID=UPI0035D80716